MAFTHLPYHPPFAWDALLRFLRGRAIPGVELVDGDGYRRTVRIGEDLYSFDGVEGAHLEQVKAGCQVIAHPSAGEPDLSC